MQSCATFILWQHTFVLELNCVLDTGHRNAHTCTSTRPHTFDDLDHSFQYLQSTLTKGLKEPIIMSGGLAMVLHGQFEVQSVGVIL